MRWIKAALLGIAGVGAVFAFCFSLMWIMVYAVKHFSELAWFSLLIILLGAFLGIATEFLWRI